MARRVALLMSTLAVLAVAATWSLAQQSVPDGSFLRAADGTIYAVSSGAKIRLVPAADTGNLLSTLRDGPSAATVDELNAAIAAVMPTPVILNPVQPLIGQSARVCAEPGIAFQADVVDAEWQKNVVGRDATGTAMWAVVFVNLTNLTNADVAPYRGGTPAIQLVDERGRSFAGDIGFALFDFQNQLAQANGLTTFSAPVRPGIAEQRVIGFEVAPDVQRLTLASQGTC